MCCYLLSATYDSSKSINFTVVSKWFIEIDNWTTNWGLRVGIEAIEAKTRISREKDWEDAETDRTEFLTYQIYAGEEERADYTVLSKLDWG
jgi:hypothetical protein